MVQSCCYNMIMTTEVNMLAFTARARASLCESGEVRPVPYHLVTESLHTTTHTGRATIGRMQQ